MKDKIPYTPLAVVLARLLLQHIDAPDSARNAGTVDCSLFSSWLITNKLMTRDEVKKIGFDSLNEEDYTPAALIMYDMVFNPQYEGKRDIIKDMMCFGLFLVKNEVMTDKEAEKIIDTLLERLDTMVQELVAKHKKTAFDGDFILKVEE